MYRQFRRGRNIDTGIAVTALTIHCCPVPSARCSWLDEPCCRPLLTPEMLRRCCYVALVMVGSLSCVDIVGIFPFVLDVLADPVLPFWIVYYAAADAVATSTTAVVIIVFSSLRLALHWLRLRTESLLFRILVL